MVRTPGRSDICSQQELTARAGTARALLDASEAEKQELKARVGAAQALLDASGIEKLKLAARVSMAQALLDTSEAERQALKPEAGTAQALLDASEAEQQDLNARLSMAQALLDAAEAERQKLMETHAASLRRLERDLLLSRKERRVREALEHAISVIRGSEDDAHEGGSIVFGCVPWLHWCLTCRTPCHAPL